MKDIENHGEKLDVIDWAGKLVMTKVARAIIVGLTTRTTLLSVFQDAHSGIKETANLGLIPLIGRI
jgi:hypothetical protein